MGLFFRQAHASSVRNPAFSLVETTASIPRETRERLKMSRGINLCVLLTLLAGQLGESAPFPVDKDSSNGGKASTKLAAALSDVPVEQLEKLKSLEYPGNQPLTPGHESHHLETHRLEATVKNGELVSRVSQNATAESTDGERPRVHAETEVVLPAEGVHKVIVQDGSKVSVQETGHEAHKEKVFKGAARLVQPSSVAADSPPAPAHTPAAPAHTHTSNGNRRSADTTGNRQTPNEHYSYPGVQYSPLDMAEYVLWTGDEKGVTLAVEQFLQDGVLSKDEAINYLLEIKYYMEYLLSQPARPKEEDPQQRASNLVLQQLAAKDKYSQYWSRPRVQFPLGTDAVRGIPSSGFDMSNRLPALPIDSRYDISKRTNDPMITTNLMDTSDYERESTPPVTEEEYEEMMEKLRAADSLYTQYTLEEVIYQLAKMMFVQTFSREASESRLAMQRFMNFLEVEAGRGQLSRNIEKKVLDVMISALSDTVAEHPEFLQPHDSYGPSSSDRYIHPALEMNARESPLSRALLAAYKEEVAKGQLLQKMKGFVNGN